MTTHEKRLIAAGYTKTRVGELRRGQVVRRFGVDKMVDRVEQDRSSTKRVWFGDGTSDTFGNAVKLWATAVANPAGLLDDDE